MRNLLLFIGLTFSLFGFGQRWHFQYGFKVGAGFGQIEPNESLLKTQYLGTNFGFTGRVTKKDFILDMGVLMNYTPTLYSSHQSKIKTDKYGLVIPVSLGYILINKPLFKWNVQAGFQNHFVFSRKVDKSIPESIEYAPYQIGGLITTGIEVAWFIFDVSYSPFFNSMFKGQKNNFNHSLNISLGLIF